MCHPHRRLIIGALAIVAALPAWTDARNLLLRPIPSESLSSPIAQAVDTPDAKDVIESMRREVGRHVRREPVSASEVAGMALQSRIGRDVELRMRAGVGTPMQIKGRALQPSTRSIMALSTEPADLVTAREFLQANRRILGLFDVKKELRMVAIRRDDQGGTHIRFDQVWNGLPVWPAALNIHLNRVGEVELLDGFFVPTPRRMALRPTVTAARARDIAVGLGCFNSLAPELIVFAPGDRMPTLAWKVHTACVGGISNIIIDASQGFILTKNSLIHAERVEGSGVDLAGIARPLTLWHQGASYYMIDTSKAMWTGGSDSPFQHSRTGSIAVFDAMNFVVYPPLVIPATSFSPTSWNSREAVSAAHWLSRTYDYFSERHQLKSFDGEGTRVHAFVRLGTDCQTTVGPINAFWNGSSETLNFGDCLPFAGLVDVVGHEYSHGVTASHAGLIYQGQSGALNEAFSDIFGEMTENFALGSNDWVLGATLPPDYRRSMAAPGQYSQPSRMSQYLNTASDNGGVHINSGIINHAFYRLAHGDPGAIGVGDAARIFFRAFTQHLVPNSKFIDARLACITAADSLFGSASPQAARTREAFDAVEIFDAGATQPPPPLPVIPGPDSTIFLFEEAGAIHLGRREAAQGDPVQGSFLSPTPVMFQRPAVSGDGKLVIYVDAENDACVGATDSSSVPECIGYPGLVHSIAYSPDSKRIAMILRDEATGLPEGTIHVLDFTTEQTRVIDLYAPTSDGGFEAPVQYADAMDFSSDGRYLFYDGLTETTDLDGDPIALWSIFFYDWLRDQVVTLIPPVPPYQVAYPSVGQTSDRYLAFDVLDPTGETSKIFVGDLFSGDLGLVAKANGYGVPAFSGDDRTLLFSSETNTTIGYSLFSQALSADRLQPTGGPSLSLGDAAFGVLYRRGAYAGPTGNRGRLQFSASAFSGAEGASSVIVVNRVGGVFGQASVVYQLTNGTATGGSDFIMTSGTLSWADGDADPRTFIVEALADSLTESTETVQLRLTAASGGSLGSPTVATLSIANKAPLVSVPSSPANLRASVTSGSTAVLQWEDRSTNETAFNAYFSFDGVAFEKFADLPANSISMEVTNLSRGVRYWLRLTATNSAGESLPSNVVSVVTGGGKQRAVRK